MLIFINGEERKVSDKLTVQKLLQELGIAEQRLAVEINQQVVPRSTLSEHIIQPNDSIEIIHAIGGG